MGKLWDQINEIVSHDDRQQEARVKRLIKSNVEMQTRREREYYQTYMDDARLGFTDGRDVS